MTAAVHIPTSTETFNPVLVTDDEPKKKPVVYGLPTSSPPKIDITLLDGKVITEDDLPAILQQWGGRIVNVAFNTSLKCIDGMYDFEEIAARLKIAVWLALTKFDPSAGMSLDSWIFGQIQQAAGLIVEEQFHNRDLEHGRKARKATHLSIDTTTSRDDEGNEVDSIQIIDPTTDLKAFAMEDAEEVQRLRDVMKKAMRTEFEFRVFDKIVSGDYNSDQLIADEEGVDFAKVGDVRLRMKIALAIECKIPFPLFSASMGCYAIARQVSESFRLNHRQWKEEVVPLMSEDMLPVEK